VYPVRQTLSAACGAGDTGPYPGRRIFLLVDDPVPAVPAPVVPGLTGLTVLARGGYATVYRAVQESIGRDVAVKIENRSLDNEHDRRRFMREARAAGRMSSHPHVVDLFDAGHTSDGHPYLIMELCDGSYADRLRASPLHPVEVRDVGVKIADALTDAHRLGVFHRDVKPANILVSGFGEPALADFGLAVLTEARDLSITMDVLTPAYAPKEMFRANCEPSPAADVYALSATLYALLRGKPPRWFEHRDPSLLELLELFDEPIPDLPGVPEELLDVLRSGMVNDAAARPTAEQLRDRLTALAIQPPPVPAEDAVRVTPEPVSRPDSWSMPTQPRPDELTGDRPAETPAPAPVPVRRGRWPFLGAGVAVLMLGLLAGALWYGVDRPRHVNLVATGPHGATSSASAGPRVAIGGCMLGAVGASCPTAPQCFDALTVSSGVARAQSLPCTKPHTWEVFALGSLPADVPSVAYPGVKEQQAVARVCNPATLTLIDIDAGTWQVDVLPPSPEAFASGDRTFRCLAGTGPNRQRGSAFVP
jgi:tRNA A-37 threonylcarbamoyl transferase component Bud32